MHMRCLGSFFCLPLCQDFIQVLSMFSNFDFGWPPAVKTTFNAFSVVNFNFELLAPECSVSLNFERKWCVCVLHPWTLSGLLWLGTRPPKLTLTCCRAFALCCLTVSAGW